MLEQDGRESGGVEVRAEEKTLETGVEEATTGPRLFSELGTGITTREVVIPTMAAREAWAREMACTTDERTLRGQPCGRGSMQSCHLVTIRALRETGGDVMSRDRIVLRPLPRSDAEVPFVRN